MDSTLICRAMIGLGLVAAAMHTMQSDSTTLQARATAACRAVIGLAVLESSSASFVLMLQRMAVGAVLVFCLSQASSSTTTTTAVREEEEQQPAAAVEYLEEAVDEDEVVVAVVVEDEVEAVVAAAPREEELTLADLMATPQLDSTEDELDEVLVMLKRLTLNDRVLASAKKELRKTPAKQHQQQQVFAIHSDDGENSLPQQQTRTTTQQQPRTPFRALQLNNNNTPMRVSSKKPVSFALGGRKQPLTAPSVNTLRI